MWSVFLLAILMMVVASAMPPIQVTANVRGKRYEVTGETVEDVCNAVEDCSGLDAEQQSILFRGKLLDRESKLEDLGVAPGDTLNVVKGRRQRKMPSAEEVASPMDFDMDAQVSSDAGMGDGMGSMGGLGGLGDMMSGMGGAGGMGEEELKKAMENVNPEEMQKAMQAMDEILDSDFVDEYFADDERLENARQQMLSNLDQYDDMMPGFKEQVIFSIHPQYNIGNPSQF
jgi:hypothetical protein